MSTHVIRTGADRDRLVELIRTQKLPFTMDVKKGEDRTVEQNRLQRLWHREAAQQLRDESPEHKRAYCKLHFGVPMLCAEDDDFREAYERVVGSLPYELQLMAMMEPLDFPVTRLMTTNQKHRFLNSMYEHYTGLGVKLTEPEDKRFKRAS